MNAHQKMIDAARNTKRTLYVVSAFYVGIGFVLAAASAMQGDRLGAFLGFVIISGALAVAVLLRSVLRFGVRVSALGETLHGLQERSSRIELTLAQLRHHLPPPELESEGDDVTDLGALGPADLSLVTAATLDRSVYPRLVATMDEAPPAESVSPPSHVPLAKASTEAGGVAAEQDRRSDEPVSAKQSGHHRNGGNGHVEETDAEGIAPVPMVNGHRASRVMRVRNLLFTWREAVMAGDLATCREVYAALVDVADSAVVRLLRARLSALESRVERALRAEFTAHLAERDIPSLLLVGSEIRRLLPERPIAGEFARIEPLLRAKMNAAAPTST